MIVIFLILFKYHKYLFTFSTALQKLYDILTCFLEDKVSTIFHDIQIQILRKKLDTNHIH